MNFENLNYGHKKLNISENIKECIYSLEIIYSEDNNLYSLSSDTLELLFKKFSNLYMVSPDYFKEIENYTDTAIKVSAHNILFTNNKTFLFDKLKEYVKLNPFVTTYCCEFCSQSEQNELFFEAFKNTGKECFFNNITDDSFKEDIYFDLYFNKPEFDYSAIQDKIDDYINSFNKDELDMIKNIKCKVVKNINEEGNNTILLR